MKNNINLIGQFRTDWIKYSDYETKNDENGTSYITPTEDATFSIYNPFDKSKELVFDLIEIGDTALNKEIDKEIINDMVLDFVKEYGLLGIITSSVYNKSIIGESKVLLTDNNPLKVSEKIMDEDKYLSLFIPFADEDEVYVRKLGKHITLFKAEDSPKFYGKRPLVLDLVFSRFYCEKLEWIIDFAKTIATHINQILIYKNINLTESVTIMAGKFKAEKIGMTIGVLDNPYIEWDFDSLKTAIEIIYSFAVTDKNNTIKRCEHCKKAFIAKSEKEKYCSPSCRNCYNVTKSRNKKKNIDKNIEKEETEKMKEKKKSRKEAILEYKERPVSGGIYKVTNTVNGKYLLINDIDLKSAENRFNFFKKTGSGIHMKVEKDVKEFGADKFKFEILEEIEMKEGQSKKDFKEDLKALEEVWKEKFDPSKSY
ncbi:GIY-YIG nuclease family protein [[Clostridium] dakarense]|uniref:GIY-YIG nuclease family protein n=1 Tax=Faecalimicrobium dakarense TaxID=1301100 RepID=UPI0004B3965F|nr:GIY-YIG nuclease family protein [[Clostridium] dakarense]